MAPDMTTLPLPFQALPFLAKACRPPHSYMQHGGRPATDRLTPQSASVEEAAVQSDVDSISEDDRLAYERLAQEIAVRTLVCSEDRKDVHL
jgi:hypothetical protein